MFVLNYSASSWPVLYLLEACEICRELTVNMIAVQYVCR